MIDPAVLTALPDYSWTDIAKAAKSAMVTAALGGGTLTINGRTVGRITVDQAKSLYEMATKELASETVDPGDAGIILAEFR